jgi:hypothetical protein
MFDFLGLSARGPWRAPRAAAARRRERRVGAWANLLDVRARDPGRGRQWGAQGRGLEVHARQRAVPPANVRPVQKE